MTLLSHSMKATDFILTAYPLSSDKEVDQYRSFLRLFPKHPFYSNELISFGKNDNEELMYFVLLDNDNPVALMPFFMRKIIFNDKETGYNDVSSPYGYSGPLFSVDAESNVVFTFWSQIDQWYTENKVVSEFIRF